MYEPTQRNADMQAALDDAAHADGWPDIIPLAGGLEVEKPYPLDALPPIARDAVRHYQQYGQQPVAMVACSALAAMSYATQGLADVARDEVLRSPLSLNLLLCAESGERKTSGDALFMKPIWLWEREKADARNEEIKTVQFALAAHEEKVKGVKQQIQQAAKKSDSAVMAKAEHDLLQLERQKPICPVQFQAAFSDVNQQTLAVMLGIGHPSAALLCNEAAIVIGGDGMRPENVLQFYGFINTIWDGATYRRNRLTTQSADIVGRRLTCSLMMQPSVLMELLNIKKGQSRGTGFLARSLFAQPTSTMGTRYYQLPPDTAFMECFYSRIRELLEMPLPVEDERNMRLNPPVLRLTADSKNLWTAYYNQVESELGADGSFHDVADFAAKSADNAARLAGIFHVFEHGVEGEIGETTMRAALAIAGWHLDETKRVFGAMQMPELLRNAEVILQWLLARPDNSFTTSDVGQRAPSRALRRKEQWEPVLTLLCEHGYIRRQGNGYQLHPQARGQA